MKSWATILLLCFASFSSAQMHHPAGVANTYSLGEKDGFPGDNYFGLYYQTTAGKTYLLDFFGTFHVTGNNYYKPIYGIKNLAHGSTLLFYNNIKNELWVSTPKAIYIIINDSLYKTIPIPFNDYEAAPMFYRGKVFLFRKSGTDVEIFILEHFKWVKITETDLKQYQPIESISFNNFKGQPVLTLATVHKKHILLILDTLTYKFQFLKSINFSPIPKDYFFYTEFSTANSIQNACIDFITSRTGVKPEANSLFTLNYGSQKYSDLEHTILIKDSEDIFEFAEIDSLNRIKPETIVFETNDNINGFYKNNYHNYLLATTGNKPIRVFPYIKKYPHSYNNKHSNNIFAIAQDDYGRIWAGNYQNQLSIITPSLQFKIRSNSQDIDKVSELSQQPFPFMNASLNYHGNIYLVGESSNGGILRYHNNGKMSRVHPGIPVGYYLFLSKRNKRLYMPSAEYPTHPIYFCDINDLDKDNINWHKIDTSNGISAFGFTTLTEDTVGRLWIGHPKKGIAVYNPVTRKGKTYDARLDQSPIGFISCLTDKRGTVWMGSDDKGLWYYRNYKKDPAPENLEHIDHPLLNTVKRITAMTIYKSWLVLGCYNKICLFNLDSFYVKNKIIVRYLNPQEAAFTSFTEQNTMLVSKTDSTLWFSTSDMLYQWDINTWLNLPEYKVNISTFLQYDTNRIVLSAIKPVSLKAGLNSFDIAFEYLSPDALPRYTRTALIKEKDSLIFSEPDMQSRFSYKNLSNGRYTFYVEIFEQDGNTSHYQYSFVINKYFWQKWWFWVLISILFLSPVIMWLNTRRKKAIQEKQISHLNVVSLSNQFRPHFILNALNTIGADLKDKPAAETVISRLGESIDLIFSQSQTNKVSHPLQKEWILVLNVIEIHKVMYLPDIEIRLPDPEWLDKNKFINIPVGILEIAVENALLHGLRNKKHPPYCLTIEGNEDDSGIYFIIIDNGIGREKAAQISSFRNHGKGLKNLTDIIEILNRYNKNKIKIEYLNNDISLTGTIVLLTIPKEYHYEY